MIEQYAASVYSALLKDLSDVEVPKYSYNNGKRSDEPYKIDRQRPRADEVEIYSFPQTWSSTALGFGGIGGQAFTNALTVAVVHGREACVYFGGTFAYKIAKRNHQFYDDLRAHEMHPVSGAHGRYEYV